MMYLIALMEVEILVIVRLPRKLAMTRLQQTAGIGILKMPKQFAPKWIK